MAREIFLSYRRDDSQIACDRIFDTLSTTFGSQRVFRDHESITTGTNFLTAIYETLARCGVVLVLLGPQWGHIAGSDGKPRLADPQDVVRREIETAFALQKPIIPVLVLGASMPTELELPSSLVGLSTLQSRKVRADPDYRIDIDRLIVDISRYVPLVPTSTITTRRIRARARRLVSFVATLLTLLLALAALATWIDIPFLTSFVTHFLGR